MPAAIPRAPGPDRVDPAEGGPRAAEAGPGGPEAAGEAEPPELDDRLVRAIGIPAFGLSIPHLTGLYRHLGPGDLVWWLGAAWFVALSAAIWHGNRWLLFEQRRHWDWFQHGARKVMMLLAAIVLYTAPLTAVALVAWYGWSGLGAVDWVAVRIVVLVNVLCVVFITHVYETVFLIKDRGSDMVRVAQLERARAEAELAALRAQLDPHFVFNSLNTLSHLVETDPRRAREFNERLADVYRYMLRQRERDLVGLGDELAMVREYVWLLRIRFGDAIQLRVLGDQAAGGRLPPLSLQLLVENAVKHNELGEDRPLEIEIDLRAGEVAVSTSYRPRRLVRPSAGIGLRNLDERYRLLGAGSIRVRPGPDRFEVVLPLVEVA
ncbi:MAG TPA: histidine kinase [Kofleriaceae bacterium]|nr:histidine kinase [Kofleriaceae bacterium]